MAWPLWQRRPPEEGLVSGIRRMLVRRRLHQQRERRRRTATAAVKAAAAAPLPPPPPRAKKKTAARPAATPGPGATATAVASKPAPPKGERHRPPPPGPPSARAKEAAAARRPPPKAPPPAELLAAAGVGKPHAAKPPAAKPPAAKPPAANSATVKSAAAKKPAKPPRPPKGPPPKRLMQAAAVVAASAQLSDTAPDVVGEKTAGAVAEPLAAGAGAEGVVAPWTPSPHSPAVGHSEVEECLPQAHRTQPPPARSKITSARCRNNGAAAPVRRIAFGDEILALVTSIRSWRCAGEELWFTNPGSCVTCGICDGVCSQAQGRLQGEAERSQFAQPEFLCYACSARVTQEAGLGP